eukprot:GILJ01003394.1.p1 GENE.GILJ01003394.1~~GILJ01003394.1.p1  ORF type:complete len:451 (+),score=49.55 GILJ01003394.1:390-1742(+)
MLASRSIVQFEEVMSSSSLRSALSSSDAMSSSAPSRYLTDKWVYLSAAIIRLGLILYGEWQDANMIVKYTDVDYIVYSDAARFVVENQSPFARLTYRYTPLLAYLLVPNIVWFQWFGKLLFAGADLAIAYLLQRILQMRGVKHSSALLLICSWVFNPMAFNISTRGNADSLVCLLVVLTLYLLLQKQIIPAAVAYGLSVHFKIYPIIYALPFLFFLDDAYLGRSQNQRQVGAVKRFMNWLNYARVQFSLISGGIFLILLAVFYYIYGWEFLYETYLYHFVRTDNRHNFSVYFYSLYLHYELPSRTLMGLLAFIPQWSLIMTLGYRYAADITFAMFVQTVTFVAFNKVCTAQYFLWYLSLLPLILPCSRLRFRWRGVAMLVCWFAAELHWVYYAYGLELLGQNKFLEVWLAGILFFVVNVWNLVQIISHHRFYPTFRAGKLLPLVTADKDM